MRSRDSGVTVTIIAASLRGVSVYVTFGTVCIVLLTTFSACLASLRACVLYRYYVTAAATGDDYDNHIHSGVASSCIGVSDYRPLSAFRT